MDEFEVIRKFVADSDFSAEVKDALMQSIALEIQGKPVSEYLALVKKLAARN